MSAETGTAAAAGEGPAAREPRQPPAAGAQSPEERARRAEAALEEALAERNRLWAELHRRAATDTELEYYRNLTVELMGSISWRVTAPLRLAKRAVEACGQLIRRALRRVRRRSTG